MLFEKIMVNSKELAIVAEWNKKGVHSLRASLLQCVHPETIYKTIFKALPQSLWSSAEKYAKETLFIYGATFNEELFEQTKRYEREDRGVKNDYE